MKIYVFKDMVNLLKPISAYSNIKLMSVEEGLKYSTLFNQLKSNNGFYACNNYIVIEVELQRSKRKKK